MQCVHNTSLFCFLEQLSEQINDFERKTWQTESSFYASKNNLSSPTILCYCNVKCLSEKLLLQRGVLPLKISIS